MASVTERRAKYGSRKAACSVCQAMHDSRKERTRCWELSQWEAAGVIRDLRRQVRHRLDVNGEHVCDYVADFRYLDQTGAPVVEDVKSEATRKLPVYRLKAKLMWACLRIKIRET